MIIKADGVRAGWLWWIVKFVCLPDTYYEGREHQVMAAKNVIMVTTNSLSLQFQS